MGPMAERRVAALEAGVGLTDQADRGVGDDHWQAGRGGPERKRIRASATGWGVAERQSRFGMGERAIIFRNETAPPFRYVPISSVRSRDTGRASARGRRSLRGAGGQYFNLGYSSLSAADGVSTRAGLQSLAGKWAALPVTRIWSGVARDLWDQGDRGGRGLRAGGRGCGFGGGPWSCVRGGRLL